MKKTLKPLRWIASSLDDGVISGLLVGAPAATRSWVEAPQHLVDIEYGSNNEFAGSVTLGPDIRQRGEFMANKKARSDRMKWEFSPDIPTRDFFEYGLLEDAGKLEEAFDGFVH